VDYLLKGRKGDTAQLEADAAAYGVILEPHHLKDPDYELWPEHQPALELFMRCMTQWRATSGGVIGLDYGVVLQLASLYQIQNPGLVLEDLQVMELHAREIMNKRMEKI
jgi:hypothetical protein